MANKVNYNKETCKIIDKIKESGYRPKLLLHVCCAPCSSYVLEWLGLYFDIYIDFYNPNLDSLEEYERRLEEVRRLKKEMEVAGFHDIHVLQSAYQKSDYDKVASIREKDIETGAACNACYALRLRHSGIAAIKHQCDYFTTTLTISPMKSAEVLNKIGFSLEKELNVKYLPADFKKQNGYKRSIELSKEYHLYRQDYCGCIYSKQERDRRLSDENN